MVYLYVSCTQSPVQSLSGLERIHLHIIVMKQYHLSVACHRCHILLILASIPQTSRSFQHSDRSLPLKQAQK